MSQRFVNFSKEFAYILLLYFLTPLMPFYRSHIKNPSNKSCVIFVHGYCRNRLDWVWMCKQLEDTKYDLLMINLFPPFASIEMLATKCLATRISNLQNQYNYKNIILVGHSMGGLVASYYKEFVDSNNLIKAVIAIGTPFNGTKFFDHMFGGNARQMRIGDPLQEKIALAIQPSLNDYFTISSGSDTIVTPRISAEIKDIPASHTLRLQDENHFSMLHSACASSKIRCWLSEVLAVGVDG